MIRYDNDDIDNNVENFQAGKKQTKQAKAKKKISSNLSAFRTRRLKPIRLFSFMLVSAFTKLFTDRLRAGGR